jgi:DnaJ-domain-containing protein 1
VARRGRTRTRDDDDTVAISFPEPTMSDTRADEYEAWGARLQAKRARSNQKYVGAPPDAGPPTYWDSEHVFRESERVGADERGSAKGADLAPAYAALGLDPTASSKDVERAFRRLAKEHHPDRHVAADDAAREFHLARMRRINDAYAQLRRDGAT